MSYSKTDAEIDSGSLARLVQADGFAGRALHAIGKIHQAHSDADILNCLRNARQALGADHGVFISFVRNDGSGESFRFLIDADMSWCLEYQAAGWYADDPWLLYACANSEPVSCRDIALRTPAQRGVRELARFYGVASAFIVPAPAAGGLSRLGVLILGSSKAGFFDSSATLALRVPAQGLAMELQAWWVHKVRAELIIQYRVSDEDMVLLRAQRDNKPTKVVASEWGVTPASIDSRWQRLNGRLKVPHRRAAALFAAEFGVI